MQNAFNVFIAPTYVYFVCVCFFLLNPHKFWVLQTYKCVCVCVCVLLGGFLDPVQFQHLGEI